MLLVLDKRSRYWTSLTMPALSTLFEHTSFFSPKRVFLFRFLSFSFFSASTTTVWILLFKNGGRPFAADRVNSLAGFVVGSQGQS